jgi:hypothetical protein
MKIGNWFKGLVIGGLITLGTFIAGKANAVGMAGFVHDSPNGISGKGCPVKIYRSNVTGGIDTVYTTTNSLGRYLKDTQELDPEPSPGAPLIAEATKDTLGKKYNAKVTFSAGDPYNYDVCLNDPDKPGYTLNIKNVSDTSSATKALPLQAISWAEKNPSQKDTSIVDTLSGGARGHYSDYWSNTAKQDSSIKQGDKINTTFYKFRNDTTWKSDTSVTVDSAQNVFGDAIFVADRVLFPQNFSVFKDISLENKILQDSVSAGTVITPKVIVKNNGTINQAPYVKCKIGTFYADSTQKTIAPGVDTITFSPCTLSVEGNYDVKYVSDLAGDVNPANDSLETKIEVTPIGINEDFPTLDKFIAKPSIAVGGRFYTNERVGKIYDATGRALGENDYNMAASKNGYEIKMNTSGVYFVNGQSKDARAQKVVALK